jgi:hypothetical protein
VVITDADQGREPLPAQPVVPLTLAEFSGRARWDQASLTGRRVRLTGFVTPAREGGWYLTRMSLRCCAADAMVWRVAVTAAGPVPWPANGFDSRAPGSPRLPIPTDADPAVQI